jgi:hypothetical protein
MLVPIGDMPMPGICVAMFAGCIMAGCVIIRIVCAMFIGGCPCAGELAPVGGMPMPGVCGTMFIGCMPIGPVMGGIMPNGCVGAPTIMLPGGVPLIMPPGDMMPPAACMPCCCSIMP